jgi:hypothetical protein
MNRCLIVHCTKVIDRFPDIIFLDQETTHFNYMLRCFNTMKSYVMVDVLLTFGKRLYDHIIAQRETTWDHITRLIPRHCIEVPVPSEESLSPCLCVLWVSMLRPFLRCFH